MYAEIRTAQILVLNVKQIELLANAIICVNSERYWTTTAAIMFVQTIG